MKIYLAARYGRRLELCDYRAVLHDRGHIVTSRWLAGDHEMSDGVLSDELQRRFAHDDVGDIAGSDLLIAFAEAPFSGHSRGGRHVELGLALGLGKPVWIVGWRENIFCWHDGVRFFASWRVCLAQLKQVEE